MSPVYASPASDLASSISLALAATQGALEQLNRYAQATDQPSWHAVAAADSLDAATKHLAVALSGGGHD